jgi:hypothetical protein
MGMPGTTNYLDKAAVRRDERKRKEQREKALQEKMDKLLKELEGLGFKARVRLSEDELATQKRADRLLISLEDELVPLDAVETELHERKIQE